MATRRSGVLIFIAMVAAAPLPSAAQAPQLPPRDVGPAGAQSGTGVIRGTIIDAQTKRPLRRARVNLTGPGITTQGGLSASTDEEGRYELSELPAGRFTLAAQRGGYLQLRYGQRRPGEQPKPLELADGQALDGIDFALPRASLIAGRIIDELGEPMAGVLVSAQRYLFSQGVRRLMPDSQVVRSDDQGEYRIPGLMPGTYTVAARTLEKWTVQAGGREETLGYAPTFFPGVSDPGQATRVTVATGQELRNIDFSLVPGRAASIAGTAVDSRGQPISNVVVSYEVMGTGGGTTGIAAQGSVAPDGQFHVRDLPPGEYRLQGTGKQEAFAMPIVVAGEDLTNLILTTTAGWTVRGKVTIDSDAPARLRRRDVTISPLLLTPRVTSSQGPVQREAVNDDWTFSVSGVVGRARLRVGLPDGWAVKAVMQGGSDIADTPLDLRSGEELTDVEVFVTDHAATVTGQLVDANGRGTDGTLVLFPADATRWFEGSRHVRVGRPDQQGRYRMSGVLPGDYLAVALDYIEQNTWNDPEILESLRRHARPVALPAGTHTVNVMVVTP